MMSCSGPTKVFIFKQKTAYEMRISDWSSDVCSSVLPRFVISGLYQLANAAQIVARKPICRDGAPYDHRIGRIARRTARLLWMVFNWHRPAFAWHLLPDVCRGS